MSKNLRTRLWVIIFAFFFFRCMNPIIGSHARTKRKKAANVRMWLLGHKNLRHLLAVVKIQWKCRCVCVCELVCMCARDVQHRIWAKKKKLITNKYAFLLFLYFLLFRYCKALKLNEFICMRVACYSCGDV